MRGGKRSGRVTSVSGVGHLEFDDWVGARIGREFESVLLLETRGNESDEKKTRPKPLIK